MTADVITWTPFGGTPDRAVPITLFNGIIHCRSITEPYMPDRVLTRFGLSRSPLRIHFSRKKFIGVPRHQSINADTIRCASYGMHDTII
ncbi:hypothetical protein Dimus_020827 [Dionaea muscipula]